MLIHGRTEESVPDYSIYGFSVVSIPVIQEKNKILTILSQLRFNYKCAGEIVREKADAVVSVAIQGALGGSIAKRRNTDLRFVYDCNELYLESISGRFKKVVWGAIQRRVLGNADIILHAEQRRLDYFHQHYKTCARPFLLENLPMYRMVQSREKQNKPMRVVYLGGFAPERCCTQIVQAFADADPKEIRLDLIGFYGRKEYESVLLAEVEKCAEGAVRILPPVSHSEMYDVLAEYDIGLAFYQNINLNNYYCAPNKVYDYIQMGIPVITNDYPGLKEIVEENGVGVCLPEVATQTIKGALQKILEQRCSGNISDAVRRRYSWEHQEDGYQALFT